MNKQQIIEEEIARVQRVILSENGAIDKDPYQQGRRAYETHKEIDDNPYGKYDRNSDAQGWNAGWLDAESEWKNSSAYNDDPENWNDEDDENESVSSIPLNRVKQVTEQFLLEDQEFGFRFYKEGFQSPKEIAKMLEDALQLLKKGKTHGTGWSVFKVGSEFHKHGHNGH